MAFLHKYQYDDVFLRSISVGLLNLLNEGLYIWNRISDSNLQEIKIPFYYHSAGDEKFMQEIYLNETLNDCVDKKIIEGNIDVIPRGVIKLDTCTINVATFTNRFVKGEYTIEDENGELFTYVAPVIIIPLDLVYSVQIEFDSIIDVFKGLQKTIETFYKMNTFKVLYNGMVIQASAAFPEDTDIQNTFEFSFGDLNPRKLEFTLAIETNFPVIDNTKRFLKSNKIESITIKATPNIKVFPTYNIPPEQNYISKTSFETDESPQDKIIALVPPVKPAYPEPVSPTGQFDPGEPGDTPSTPVVINRNEDGSIGIPGTEDYIDSYGNSYYDLTNTQRPGTKPLNEELNKSNVDEELPNVDNNLNDVGNFGYPNNSLPNK